MEPSQFDEFTKLLATPTSRRKALKTIMASTFGSMLAFGGIGTAFAKKRCPAGYSLCNGKCINTNSDPNHCGDCDVKCASDLCVNGLCCPPGAIKCGNFCCDGTCLNGTTCCPTGQTCGTTCCPVGQKCLNGTTCCPAKQVCGNICCPAGMICQGGVCAPPPPCSNPSCLTSTQCSRPGCGCVTTTEGTSCVQEVCTFVTCTKSADCPSGQVCFTQGCCGGGSFCVPLCGGAASVSDRTHGMARTAWH